MWVTGATCTPSSDEVSGVRTRPRDDAHAESTPPPPNADFMGTRLCTASLDEVTAWLLAAATTRAREPKVLSFAGASTMLDAEKKRALARADLVVAEGRATQALSALACDAFDLLVRFFASTTAERPLRVFLFGGGRGRANLAAEWIKWQFPGVRVVGTAEAGEATSVAEDVNEACADVLVVGLGEQWSDRWILENAALLDVGLVVSAGGLVEAMGGNPRARRTATTAGLIEALAFFLRACLFVALGVG